LQQAGADFWWGAAVFCSIRANRSSRMLKKPSPELKKTNRSGNFYSLEANPSIPELDEPSTE
jgi:hypothetical protein